MLCGVTVYVMLAMEHEFEGMMIAMQRKGLLDDGEYFLVGVDSKPYDPSDPQVYIEGVLIIIIITCSSAVLCETGIFGASVRLCVIASVRAKK